MRKRKLTKAQALEKLIETRELSTGMLEPLGIPMEFFLRFCQISKAHEEKVIDGLIARFSK